MRVIVDVEIYAVELDRAAILHCGVPMVVAQSRTSLGIMATLPQVMVSTQRTCEECGATLFITCAEPARMPS